MGVLFRVVLGCCCYHTAEILNVIQLWEGRNHAKSKMIRLNFSLTEALKEIPLVSMLGLTDTFLNIFYV